MADEIVQVEVNSSDPIIIELADNVSVPTNVAYHHAQGVSSSTWDIEHNLGFYPNVTTMDSSGSIAEGEIEHLTKYRLRVTFSAPFSGNAYLS